MIRFFVTFIATLVVSYTCYNIHLKNNVDKRYLEKEDSGDNFGDNFGVNFEDNWVSETMVYGVGVEDNKHDIEWSDIIFIMNIFDSERIDEFIKAHFDTWLKHVGKGATIVFLSNDDDKRTKEEILPLAGSIEANCVLYK